MVGEHPVHEKKKKPEGSTNYYTAIMKETAVIKIDSFPVGI